MADIPVERKQGGFPWWLIPLIILLLLLPLLYFCSRNTAVVDNTNGNANRLVTTNANNAAMINNNGTTNTGSNVAVVVNSNTGANMINGNASNAASGAAITDVNAFGAVTDKSTLVGRSTTLSGVRVNRVLSDKVFTVKSGSGEFFVMLDNNLDSAGGKEKQIRIQAGQNVNLGGSFRGVPTGETKEESKEGGLNKNEYAQMKGQQVYLHATSVEDAK